MTIWGYRYFVATSVTSHLPPKCCDHQAWMSVTMKHYKYILSNRIECFYFSRLIFFLELKWKSFSLNLGTAFYGKVEVEALIVDIGQIGMKGNVWKNKKIWQKLKLTQTALKTLDLLIHHFYILLSETSQLNDWISWSLYFMWSNLIWYGTWVW